MLKTLIAGGAAFLAATALTPVPAEAQRGHGWHRHGGAGWHGGRGWRGHRAMPRGPRWRGGWAGRPGGPGWNRGWNRGWNGGWGRPLVGGAVIGVGGGWGGPAWGGGGPGWGGGWGYGGRCQLVPGPWGPVRQCFW